MNAKIIKVELGIVHANRQDVILDLEIVVNGKEYYNRTLTFMDPYDAFELQRTVKHDQEKGNKP